MSESWCHPAEVTRLNDKLTPVCYSYTVDNPCPALSVLRLINTFSSSENELEAEISVSRRHPAEVTRPNDRPNPVYLFAFNERSSSSSYHFRAINAFQVAKTNWKRKLAVSGATQRM
jgi:hypothetical protein